MPQPYGGLLLKTVHHHKNQENVLAIFCGAHMHFLPSALSLLNESSVFLDSHNSTGGSLQSAQGQIHYSFGGSEMRRCPIYRSLWSSFLTVFGHILYRPCYQSHNDNPLPHKELIKPLLFAVSWCMPLARPQGDLGGELLCHTCRCLRLCWQSHIEDRGRMWRKRMHDY